MKVATGTGAIVKESTEVINLSKVLQEFVGEFDTIVGVCGNLLQR